MVCLGAISLLCAPKHQFFILTAKKIHEKDTGNRFFHYLCKRYHSRSRRIDA